MASTLHLSRTPDWKGVTHRLERHRATAEVGSLSCTTTVRSCAPSGSRARPFSLICTPAAPSAVKLLLVARTAGTGSQVLLQFPAWACRHISRSQA